MDAKHSGRRRSLLLWPLVLAWRFVTVIANRMGILPTLGLGLVITLVGYVLCSTIIGAVIGLPLLLLGLLLLARGLY